MTIVVLDRLHFQKPHEQFLWHMLEKLSSFTYFDHTDDHEVTHRAKDADIILTLKNDISAEVMQTLHCKLLVKLARVSISLTLLQQRNKALQSIIFQATVQN